MEEKNQNQPQETQETKQPKKGIKPNVAVKDNEKTKTDEQLNRAISILKK